MELRSRFVLHCWSVQNYSSVSNFECPTLSVHRDLSNIWFTCQGLKEQIWWDESGALPVLFCNICRSNLLMMIITIYMVINCFRSLIPMKEVTMHLPADIGKSVVAWCVYVCVCVCVCVYAHACVRACMCTFSRYKHGCIVLKYVYMYTVVVGLGLFYNVVILVNLKATFQVTHNHTYIQCSI